ncbi:hypothetical protein NCAST_19_00840 [Nocardia asteroides NBRC 15531]|uniref:Uncharacterized protein n=1 Tax=Nocardia asteroides NBRC 15531 TaxID=1110697 RepID=U5E3Z3_NOCAS|nr:hypothetical protein NCAST_19_00840 [Nocardia asteroides NBRC 15531]
MGPVEAVLAIDFDTAYAATAQVLHRPRGRAWLLQPNVTAEAMRITNARAGTPAQPPPEIPRSRVAGSCPGALATANDTPTDQRLCRRWAGAGPLLRAESPHDSPFCCGLSCA